MSVNWKDLSSIAATSASPRVSENHYGFMSTKLVVSALQVEGWDVVKAGQVKCRPTITNANGETRPNPNYGYQRHLINMQHPNIPLVKIGNDGSAPQIVITNSHDGRNSLKMMLGMFRFVCGNGLIVSQATFMTEVFRHKLGIQEQVMNALSNVITAAPKLQNHVEHLANTRLTEGRQITFARKALELKYGKGEDNADRFEPEKLIIPLRKEDEEGNVWSTYNMVQEKLIGRGGNFARNGRLQRGMTHIKRSVNLNTQLWDLALEFAKAA